MSSFFFPRWIHSLATNLHHKATQLSRFLKTWSAISFSITNCRWSIRFQGFLIQNGCGRRFERKMTSISNGAWKTCLGQRCCQFITNVWKASLQEMLRIWLAPRSIVWVEAPDPWSTHLRLTRKWDFLLHPILKAAWLINHNHKKPLKSEHQTGMWITRHGWSIRKESGRKYERIESVPGVYVLWYITGC